jgi:pectinesterase
MKRYIHCAVLPLFLILLRPAAATASAAAADIVVAQDGSGDCMKIQQAVDRVKPDNRERVIIHIKAGTYHEKVFIENNCITLTGDGPGVTKIECAILRRDWVKDHDGDDWGSAVINLKGSDIILRDLTVYNSYGDLNGEHDHQFAVRLMAGTRIIFENCRFIAGGGDTVSLWDKEKGMYYHRNCYFKGYVDFVCPRGWCYITGSEFYEDKKTASLWHDGELSPEQKFVVRNSSFDGIPGFKLGRRHFDARFYLINCNFSANLADIPIYRVTYPDQPERDQPDRWGDRYYFFNCHRTGGDYAWFNDNLPADLKPADITAAWTFDDRWDPEDSSAVGPVKWLVNGNTVSLVFGEPVTVKGNPSLQMASGGVCPYREGSGTSVLVFSGEQTLPAADTPLKLRENGGSIITSTAYLRERRVNIKRPANEPHE